jgi:hypothetical protein
MTTVASKRTPAGGKPRKNSAASRVSSGDASMIIGLNPQQFNRPRSLKLITEVDGIFPNKISSV